MVESSIVLCIDILIDYQIGTPVNVNFDFFKVWEFYKNYPNLRNSIEFFHVHPEGFLHYSETDKICMKGFFQAFNQSYLFHIITFNNSDIYDLNYNIVSYFWEDDKVKKYDSFYTLSNKNILILKLLSYGKENL